MADSFATPDDLATRLGRTFTSAEEDQADSLLSEASASMRAYMRRTITEATYTVTLESTQSARLNLPEWPITDVDTVTVDGSAVTDYTIIGRALHRELGWGPIYDYIRQDGSHPFVADGFHTVIPVAVVVTYTAGYATVPDDLMRACLSSCSRLLSNPTGSAQSEKIDDYAVTYWSSAQQAEGGFNRAELVILDRYRPKASTIVLSP